MSKIFLALGIFGQPLQPRRSYSTIVVKTGVLGQGRAQPAIHIKGKKATCKDMATRTACASVTCSFIKVMTRSLAMTLSGVAGYSTFTCPSFTKLIDGVTMGLTISIHPAYTMPRPLAKPTIILSALAANLILSQIVPALVRRPDFGGFDGAAARAFKLPGKKASADSESEPKADKPAKNAKNSKDAKDGKEAEEEAPKEKHKSKEEIKEEEELEAEYEAYQKQLKDLLKTVKTPFGGNEVKSEKNENSELQTISLIGKESSEASSQSPIHAARQSLRDRLFASKVYMPGRMVIGRPAEFTVRGRPGYWAALAMADKDKGAKPIYGHNLRLGPDRKVMALGKIPASGVLALKIFTPVEGDLVGGNLYFEAAVWPENKPAELELAQPLSSETQAASTANSVAISGQGERKHGVKFVPDNTSPYAHVNGPGLSSGQP
jgi:hypothetical protein